MARPLRDDDDPPNCTAREADDDCLNHAERLTERGAASVVRWAASGLDGSDGQSECDRRETKVWQDCLSVWGAYYVILCEREREGL